MADDLTEETTEHKTKLKHPKQSDKKKVSARGTPRRREEKNAAEQQRLKELEASIRAQVAAEEKAHKIVEKLVLEDEITEDFLIHSGNLITPNHYADVVEERMIAKKCGYPLCKNQLSQIPTQKYKISLRTNRVYDITERKCFCSNFCFKASKYFGSQISDSPVWTRIGESLKSFVLLKSRGSSSRAGAGDVLLGRDDEHTHSSEEIIDDCLARSDRDSYKGHQSDSEEEAAENELNKLKFTDGNQDSKETDSILTIPESGTYHDRDIPTVEVSSLSLSSSSAHDKPESYSDKRHFTSKKDTSKETYSRDTIVQSVLVVFEEWCTQSTLEYLGFSVKTEAESSFSDEKEIDPDSFMARAARFFQPAINAEEDSDSDSESGTSSKISEEDIVIKERESLNKNPVCILPPIDSKSQRTIRRRIVLDKLFRTLPDLLSEVKLTVGEISRDLTELVHTFSFCNTNITLKPLQWKIVALALLVILQRKNSLLSQAMKSCCKEFDALLGRLAITREDIDKVLSPLTSYASQNSAHSDIPKAVCTCKSSEEKDKVVVKEREDYGDMEELD